MSCSFPSPIRAVIGLAGGGTTINGRNLLSRTLEMHRRAAGNLVRIKISELYLVWRVAFTGNGKVNTSPLVFHGEANGFTSIRKTHDLRNMGVTHTHGIVTRRGPLINLGKFI
eukprot:10812300-Heterocapsa_arctica.AAC.1